MAIYARTEILAVTATPKPLKQVIQEVEALLTNPCRAQIQTAIKQLVACGSLWVEHWIVRQV